jgi:drug/metabolite transporter (DMT)-like permease
VFLVLLALGFGDVSVVIPLAGTAPLFVLLITYFLPREGARLHWRLVVGAVMIVLGVMVLTG